jgi:hypothetical protein
MTKFTQTYPTDMKYTEWLLILKYFPDHNMRPAEMGALAIYRCDLACEPNRLPMAHVAE